MKEWQEGIIYTPPTSQKHACDKPPALRYGTRTYKAGTLWRCQCGLVWKYKGVAWGITWVGPFKARQIRKADKRAQAKRALGH